MSARVQTILRVGIVAGLVLFFACYGLYKSQDYLGGPKVILETPADGEGFTNALIEIKGRAINTSSIYLNGGQIYTDEQGNFREELLLARGYNIIEVSANDKFGRSVKEIRKLVLK